MIRRLLALLVLTLALIPSEAAEAQTTYFSSSWTSGTFPQGNWDSYDSTHEGTYYNLTRVAGGCPDGNDSVSVQFIPVGTHAQFQYGWAKDSAAFSSAVATGFKYRLKGRIKPNASIQLTCNAPESVLYMKWIIFGAVSDTQRFITDLRDNGSSTTTLTLMPQLNVGGGPRASLTLGSWNAFIIEYQFASTASANDGYQKAWVATSGSFTYGSPTSSNTGLDMEVDSGRTGFGLGRFTQTTLGSGGSFGYELCNLEWEDGNVAFDTAWPTAVGGGGGGTTYSPSRPRLRRAEAATDGPPWTSAASLSAVAFVVHRRRRRAR